MARKPRSARRGIPKIPQFNPAYEDHNDAELLRLAEDVDLTRAAFLKALGDYNEFVAKVELTGPRPDPA